MRSGLSVNTANRICKHASDIQILVSSTVARQLPPGTQLGEALQVQVKGKTAPLEVFTLQS
jgi:class 3 adenylate cyclase